MSQTLPLVAALLATARDLQAAGRYQAAIDLLQRLTAFRQIAHEAAEEVHLRLADLYAELEQYKKARRHLTIALTHRPQHAAYHHRMGVWIEMDPDAGIGRAGRYYRQAVRSEPDKAEYWIDYGSYLLNAGRMRNGRAALRRAFKLASHDAELVARIAGALRDAELWDDARRLLWLARFEHPRDRRFRRCGSSTSSAALRRAASRRRAARIPRRPPARCDAIRGPREQQADAPGRGQDHPLRQRDRPRWRGAAAASAAKPAASAQQLSLGYNAAASAYNNVAWCAEAGLWGSDRGRRGACASSLPCCC